MEFGNMRWNSVPGDCSPSTLRTEAAADFSPCLYEAKHRSSQEKEKDAALVLGDTGLENKHAAVPKSFHILKKATVH